MTELVFLKLGGSLITDKDKPFTARLDKLAELANEIASSWTSDRRLVLGHGPGSFGHAAAKQAGTRDGKKDSPRRGEGREEKDYWKGFAEVWYRASQLNRFVMESLRTAGLPALALVPVAAVTARGMKVAAWDLSPIRAALEAGLVPGGFRGGVFGEAAGGG